jgi:drug/metabolite transporter (DMT)-like permease
MTWAIGSAGYSRLSRNYSVFSINFVRTLVGLPLFILTTFIISGGIIPGLANYADVKASEWGWLSLSMFASYGIGDACFLWSTRSLGLPGALAIASCYPVWTVLAGYLWGDEQVSASQVLGLFITIIGVVAVVLNGPKNGSKKGPQKSTQNALNPHLPSKPKKFSATGFLFAIGASAGWATNSYAVSRGGGRVLPPVANTLRMGMAMLLSAFLARCFARDSRLILPMKEVVPLLWLFVVEAYGGSLLYLYGLSHSPLALGATLASLAPAISVPVALAFRLEKFSVYRTLGVFAVVFGIWCLLGTF